VWYVISRSGELKFTNCLYPSLPFTFTFIAFDVPSVCKPVCHTASHDIVVQKQLNGLQVLRGVETYLGT